MSTLPVLSLPHTSELPSGVPRWLSVVSHTDPRYGGLSSAVPRLSQSLAKAAPLQMALAAFCASGEYLLPLGFEDRQVSFFPVSRRPWLTSSALRARLDDEVRRADGVHLHGLWEASTALGSRSARRLGKPYIVSAHGMLEPWALANKRWKKWWYAQLVEHRVVGRATCLHALTSAEAAQYRSFGAKNPIVVVPNAVDVPGQLSPDLFWQTFPLLRGKRLLLFLGRLHPKKGLDLLTEAWSQVALDFPDVHLVLAGPDAEGMQAKMDKAIGSRGLEATVTFTGMLDSTMKWSALAAAEVFVLPSYSEGLPMGALEALGAGLPAIVTHHCNLPEVSKHHAGWEIPAEVPALAAVLREAFRNSPEDNQVTGRRGSDLITKRYNSRHVATAMVEVYRYVLNGIPPETVEIL